MKVHQLLADPAAWTKRAMARDANGHTTYVHADDAVQWSMDGAVRKLYPNGVGDAVLERLRVALGLDTTAAVFIWNDRATHAEILEVTRRLDV